MNMRQKGRRAERAVAFYLRLRGYRIAKMSYTTRFGEVDVIAKRAGIVAFVEVKARSRDSLYAPKEAVTAQKIRKITAAANIYIAATRCELQPRFDVAEVIYTGHFMKVSEYIENAF